jgi:energy-coupling factor transporter transmembrane protein EcfT
LLHLLGNLLGLLGRRRQRLAEVLDDSVDVRGVNPSKKRTRWPSLEERRREGVQARHLVVRKLQFS